MRFRCSASAEHPRCTRHHWLDASVAGSFWSELARRVQLMRALALSSVSAARETRDPAVSRVSPRFVRAGRAITRSSWLTQTAIGLGFRALRTRSTRFARAGYASACDCFARLVRTRKQKNLLRRFFLQNVLRAFLRATCRSRTKWGTSWPGLGTRPDQAQWPGRRPGH